MPYASALLQEAPFGHAQQHHRLQLDLRHSASLRSHARHRQESRFAHQVPRYAQNRYAVAVSTACYFFCISRLVYESCWTLIPLLYRLFAFF